MKIYCKLFALLVLLIGYGCCSNPHFKCGSNEPDPVVLRNTQFNHKTVGQIKIGMPLSEFEELFGPPDKSSANTLDAKASSALKHIVYEYDMGKHPDAQYPEMFCVNKFYFNAEAEPVTLLRWDIDYVY